MMSWAELELRSINLGDARLNRRAIQIREGDVIEIFEEVTRQKERGIAADIIVRAQYNRLLFQEDGEEPKKLIQQLESSPSLGEIEFVVPATEKRSVRKVTQQVKALTVTLKPRNKKTMAKIVLPCLNRDKRFHPVESE